MVRIVKKTYKGGKVKLGCGIDKGSVLIIGKHGKELHQYSNKTAKKLGLIKSSKKRKSGYFF